MPARYGLTALAVLGLFPWQVVDIGFAVVYRDLVALVLAAGYVPFDHLVHLRAHEHYQGGVVDVEHQHYYAGERPVGFVVGIAADGARVQGEEQGEDQPEHESQDGAGADPTEPLLGSWREVVDEGESEEHDAGDDGPLQDAPERGEDGPEPYNVGHGHADRLAEDHEHEGPDQQDDDRQGHEDGEPVHLPEWSVLLHRVHHVHRLHHGAERPRNAPEGKRYRDYCPKREGALGLAVGDAKELVFDELRR